MKFIEIPAWVALEPRVLFASGYPVSFGSPTFDAAYKVAATSDGGSVVAGSFSGTADFDPSSRTVALTARGDDKDPTKDSNVYVARYDANGALVWAKQFGGEEGKFEDKVTRDLPLDPTRAGSSILGVSVQLRDQGQYVTGLKVDGADNVYLTFAFKGTIDFDPGRGKAVMASTGGNDYADIALLKLTPGGALAFPKQIGGEFTDVAMGLALDSSNQIYLSGYYTRRADFDPSGATVELNNEEARENIFIAKYSSQGALVWAKQDITDAVKQIDRSAGYSIAADSSGVYLTGSFAGRTDFDPGAGQMLIEPLDDTDTFVQKLDSAGSLVWVKTFGGKDYDGGQSIAIAREGGVVVGSFFSDTIDVDPSTKTTLVTAEPEEGDRKPKRTDLLIQKFTSAGEMLWARPLGNGGFETLGDVATTTSGNVVVTGAFYGSIDFNPGRAKNVLSSTVGVEKFKDVNDNDRRDSYDGFVQTLDANGVFVSATKFGAASDDFATSISFAANDSTRAIVAGQFRGTYVFPDGNGAQKFRPIGVQDSFVGIFDTEEGRIVA